MFVFSYKSILAQGQDSLSLKTARFAISSFVPIVGSSINEALRAVTSSISILKSSSGIAAIIVIALLIGIGVILVGENSENVRILIEQMNGVFMKVMELTV